MSSQGLRIGDEGAGSRIDLALSRSYLLLALVFFVAAPATFAKEILAIRIHLNSDDCFNCLGGLGALNELRPEIEVTMNVPIKAKTFIDEYLGNRISGSRPIKRRFVRTDPYPRSTVTTHIGAEQVFEFPLIDLYNMVAVINATHRTYSRCETIGTNWTKANSGRITTFQTEASFAYTDYLLGSGHVLNKHTGAIEWSSGQFPPGLRRQLLDSAGADSSLVRELETQIRNLGKDGVRLTSFASTGNRLLPIVSVTCPSWTDTGTIVLRELYFLIDPLKKYQINRLFQDEAARALKPHFDLDYGAILENNGFITQNFASQCDSAEMPLLSRYSLTGSIISHQHVLLNLPRYYIDSDLCYNFTSAKFSNGLYAMVSYPLIYDLEANAAYDLSRLLLGGVFKDDLGHFRYHNFDAVRHGRYFTMIAGLDNKLYRLIFDLDENKVLYKQVIRLKGARLSSIQLSQDGSVHTLTENGVRLVRWL